MKKRIALSAVVALAAGLLAAVPASAYTVSLPSTTATAPFTVDAADDVTFANASNTAITATQVAGAANYVKFSALTALSGAYNLGVSVNGGTFTAASVRCTDGSVFQTLSGGTTKLLAADFDDNASCAAAFGGGFTYAATLNATADIQVAATTAGTLTVTVAGLNDTGSGQVTSSTLQTFTVIVRAAASTVYAYSIVSMYGASTGWKGGDGQVYAPLAASAAQVAEIYVDQYVTDGSYASNAASKPVTATLTGVGSIGYDATGGYSTAYYTTSLTNNVFIPVFGDGRAGTATVTISVDGKTVSTKKVNFYGTAKSVTAVGIQTIAAAGGIATVGYLDAVCGGFAPACEPTADNDPAIAVLVKDALGTMIPLPVTMVSSDGSKVIPTGGFLDSGASDYSAGVLYQHFSLTTDVNAKSGDKVNVTFTALAQDGTVLTSNPIVVSIGGATATTTVAFDKATYSQGEKATLTITGKDSSGNPVYDGAALTGTTLTSNVAAQGTPVAVKYAAGGKATATVYAPTAVGTWTLSGLNAAGAAVSVSATVSSAADVAANAAAIAALQTSVAALQTTVASLVASLTAQIKVINTALRKIAAKMKVKL